MPEYKYRCDTCAAEFSFTLRRSERLYVLGSKCPECHKGSLVRVFGDFSFKVVG